MERIQEFYNKINGSYFLFIRVAISILTIVIAVALYTAGSASYGILTNFISDLGATSAPNGAFIAFSSGLILNSLVSPFGSLYLFIFFQKKEIKNKWVIWLWFLIDIISIIAGFFVAIFPEDTMLSPHLVAALIIFFFGMLSNFFYGILIFLTKKIANYHSIPGFILAIISITFMMSWIFVNNLSLITLLEWLVLFGGWIFGIYLGILTLKSN
ncbi:MAG: hypothetical protein ACFE9Z_04360 [Promethearchaeota archaeon]